jgi:hypothetical protein
LAENSEENKTKQLRTIRMGKKTANRFAVLEKRQPKSFLKMGKGRDDCFSFGADEAGIVVESTIKSWSVLQTSALSGL